MIWVKQHPPLPKIYFSLKTGEVRLCRGEFQAYVEAFSALHGEAVLVELQRFLHTAERLLTKKQRCLRNLNVGC